MVYNKQKSEAILKEHSLRNTSYEVRPTILLTGATGFLGRAFIEHKESKKYHIIATYRSKPGKKYANVTWVKLDLTSESDFAALRNNLVNDRRQTADGRRGIVQPPTTYHLLPSTSVARHLSPVTYLVHCGGASPNRAYADGSFDATTKGTKLLLDLAKKLRVKKFVFISSIVADFPFKGPYAESKRKAEQLVKTSGLPFTILRPETIIGPYAQDFTRLARILKTAHVFSIIGKDDNVSQPIASEDMVQILVQCLTNKRTTNKTYVAVGKESLTTEELVLRVAKQQGNTPRIVHLPVDLVRVVARLAEKINPSWGLNEERVNILTHSRKYSIPREFSWRFKSVDEMLYFLS